MPRIETTVQYPVVITPEIEKCRDFYVGYFGFEIVFEADWYIQLKHANGNELGFMRPDLPNQPEFLHGAYGGRGIIVTYDVADARGEYEKAQQMEGLKIRFPYTEEEWGQKHFIVEDPAGIFVDIVEQPS
ncbi:glyoxalase [Methanoculleus sp. Wushi-C6]|uniref:Glyoxalase n=1 Tax=Methanoculleus caldifontis TaxID=2651577 RepID=A0ABU3WYF7_9EURY|nr:VOC family protein [Methanoculleus sp. Wushi-C6]MDV2480844.1 glyoxalase [Methanoculleus sp. Wushi-C6]